MIDFQGKLVEVEEGGMKAVGTCIFGSTLSKMLFFRRTDDWYPMTPWGTFFVVVNTPEVSFKIIE